MTTERATPLARIAIAVPTFRRLHLLPQLVDDLLHQTLDVAPRACVVLVIDNDPAGTARGTIEATIARGERGLCYANVRTPGLCEVRNHALRFARDGAYDALVMIDDDERPTAGWLAELVRVAESDPADAVNGPVAPAYAAPPPAWILAGGFFDAEPDADLTSLDDGASNNCLLKVASVARFGLAFDPALNLAGGEDQLFFRQLYHRGGRIVRAKRAVVVETVPADRMTVAYLLKRYLRKGNSLAYCDRTIAGTRGALLTRAAKGVAAIARALTLLLPMTLARGKAGGVRCLCEIARGTGMLLGLAGNTVEEYKRKPSPR